MHDPLGVRGIEGVRKLRSQVEHGVGGQRTLGAVRPQGLALEQLHHQEVASLVLPDVVDRADVGMVERRGRACLLLEPGDRLLVL